MAISESLAQQELAKFAKALAHPTRIEILRLLSSQNCCYTGDLVEVLPIAQSTISQHLKELKDAGLIKGDIHLPKIKYCIHAENWQRAKSLFSSFFDKTFADTSSKKFDC
jgi:predicted transcriptional regulator